MSLPKSDLNKVADNRTTMELGAVLPLTAEVHENHLFIGGVDMVELAKSEGTALYVYDEADLRSRMESYRESFHKYYPNSEALYASKAFLNKEVLRIAAEEGDRLHTGVVMLLVLGFQIPIILELIVIQAVFCEFVGILLDLLLGEGTVLKVSLYEAVYEGRCTSK